MAVVVRCSLTLTHSIVKSPPSDALSVRPYLSGKLGSCNPSKTEKLVESSSSSLSLKDTHNRNAYALLPSSNCSNCSNCQVRWGGAAAAAVMMAIPFEALAETCEADNAMSNMPLLLAVALIGATVGGLVARQRKQELARLNEQLRQINTALRRQAKIESYAPTLSYAPTAGRITEDDIILDSRKQDLISRLKAGKNFLRNQQPDKAFPEFQAALELAKDPIEKKKAARGSGASLQRQGKYKEAIKYHSMVLDISKREKEDSGSTEAYGAIADCYTELGDLESAGKFYDEYIARLEKD